VPQLMLIRHWLAKIGARQSVFQARAGPLTARVAGQTLDRSISGTGRKAIETAAIATEQVDRPFRIGCEPLTVWRRRELQMSILGVSGAVTLLPSIETVWHESGIIVETTGRKPCVQATS